MTLRKMTAAAATLALLAACSKAPEEADTAAADADHSGHTTDAAATPAIPRTPAPAGATVFIDSPKEGEMIVSPVRVVFGATGVTIAPVEQMLDNSGHHHLLIDTDLANQGVPIPTDAKHMHFGKGQTEASVELTPGPHTLQLVLGDLRHVPFAPIIASQKINIVVK